VTWNTVRRSIYVWKIDEPQRTQGTQREDEEEVLETKSSAISAFSAVKKDLLD
jgi:hypothetical protein